MKKRILAITLALATAISLTATTFAEDTQGGINFTGTANTTPVLDLFTAGNADAGDLAQSLVKLEDVVKNVPNYPTVDAGALAEYMLGADIDFGTHDLDADNVTRFDTFTSVNDNSVIVVDATNSPTHWYEDSPVGVWELRVSRGDFTGDAGTIESPVMEMFPKNDVSYGVASTTDEESYTIDADSTLFLDGSLGYTGRTFSSKLTLGNKVPASGSYQAAITWDLTSPADLDDLDPNSGSEE